MKKLEFKCNDCEHVATTTQNLNYHIHSKHNGQRYTCTECGHKASTKRNLKYHKEAKHEKTGI